MANSGTSVTRTVQTIGSHRYIPLVVWEALWFIPSAYTGGTTSVNGDWVISYYGSANQSIPPSAVLVAKYEGAVSTASGTGTGKNRVKFADGTYIQPGITYPTSIAVQAQNDHAQGSGDYRPLIYPGQTGPGMTAALPAIPGVVGAYGAPYTAFFNYMTDDNDPRGKIVLEGIIQLNSSIAGSQTIAFMPGVQVRGEPIASVPIQASSNADAKMINGHVRFQNATVNGSQGVRILAYADSFNTAVNPYFTLGVNGNAIAGGTPQWVSFSNIILNHA